MSTCVLRRLSEIFRVGMVEVIVPNSLPFERGLGMDARCQISTQPDVWKRRNPG